LRAGEEVEIFFFLEGERVGGAKVDIVVVLIRLCVRTKAEWGYVEV
jgi:hypothetical protein